MLPDMLVVPAHMMNLWVRRTKKCIVGYIALVTSWWARMLPLKVVWILADACAVAVLALGGKRRRTAEANLAAALPELSDRRRRRILRDSVRNACRTMAETFRLSSMTSDHVRELVEAPDMTPIKEALRDGRGVIILSAHYGNWEWLGARLTAELGPMSAVAREAPHHITTSMVHAARSRHRVHAIGRNDTRQMLRTLHGGGLLGIVPDQRAGKTGILLDFLGRPAWTSTGPAVLAMRTGARVFPCFCVRQFAGRPTLVIYPEVELVSSGDRPADLVENVGRISASIERAIRDRPEQWLWMHDRWRQDRPSR